MQKTEREKNNKYTRRGLRNKKERDRKKMREMYVFKKDLHKE